MMRRLAPYALDKNTGLQQYPFTNGYVFLLFYFRRMTANQEKGKWGEEEALRFLRSKGFEILDLNWKFLHLEIDIVAREGKELVIVEVKTRGTDAFGEPEVFVNKTKQKKLIRAANLYLEQKNISDEVRFDVIGIVKKNNQKTLRHIPGAFAPGL